MIPVTVAVIVALLNWLARSTRLLICCAIGGILGGATGNLIDRFQYGRVIDFLHLHLGAADPFPYIFNLGDSAISISVGVLLIDQVFGSFTRTNTAPRA